MSYFKTITWRLEKKGEEYILFLYGYDNNIIPHNNHIITIKGDSTRVYNIMCEELENGTITGISKNKWFNLFFGQLKLLDRIEE